MKTISPLVVALGLALGISAIHAQTTVSLSVTDSVVAETWPGQSPNPGNIRVTRTGSTTSPLTVWVKYSGTAVRGVDYQFGVAVSDYVILPAGSAHWDIPINPIDDLTTEATETVRFELDDQTGSGAALPYLRGSDRVIVNLLDNDNLPPRVVVDVEALNDTGEGSPYPGAFRITRSGNMDVAVTVAYSVEGSATAGDDYAALSGSVLIPAGDEFADVVVTPVDDAELEGSETVTLTILPSSCPGTFPPPADCYSFGAQVSADLVILDNEIPPVRAVVSVAALHDAAEGTSGGPVPGAFRITRSANLDVTVMVAYAVGGTATGSADYAALSGTVVIPAGIPFADVVVAAVDDAVLEVNESVVLTIEPSACPELFPPAECYLIGESASATLTILDNEVPPTVTVAAVQNMNVAGSPAAGLGSFTAFATNGHIVSYEVRVDGTLRLTGSTGYTNPPAPGTTFQFDFAIPNLSAGPHVVQATVSDNLGISAAASAAFGITIIPPPPLTLEIIALDNDAAETRPGEPPNTAKFLYRQSGTAGDLELFFLSFAGSAREGVDYTAAYGPWINTTNGITNIWSQEITIAPIDDYIIEGTETVTLQMCFINLICIYGVCAPGGVSCGGGATVNIQDNDTNPPPFPVVHVTASDATAQEVPPVSGEPQNLGVFTLTRTAPATNDLIVSYAITGTAQNGVDYETLSITATIPTGETSATVEVRPIFDLFSEGSETVTLTLRPGTNSPTNYLLDGGATNFATVTIRDYAPTNVSAVRIKVTDAQAVEQNSASPHAVFRVERLGGLSNALTVPYKLTGTASNGVDYVALPGFVTFPVGVNFANITVIPYLDGETNEPDETVIVTLELPPSDVLPPPYLIGGSNNMVLSAGATIREDALTVPPVHLNRYQRALRIRYPSRYRTVIVPLPVLPAPAPGALAKIWAVEASSDLVTWEVIGETEDPEDFADVSQGDFPQRFYRFREVPPVEP